VSSRQERFITFRYLEADSPLHKSKPSSKFVWFGLATITVVVSSDPLTVTALILATLVLVRTLGGITLGRLRPLLILLVFVVVMTVYGVFTEPNTKYVGGQYRVFALGQLSLLGALDGFISGARFFVPAIIGLTLAYTTRQEDMTRTFAQYVPYRFAYTASIGIAFIPVLQDLYETIQKALAVRGLGFHGSWLNKIKAYNRLFFILLVGLLRQADTWALSLSNRAFGAYPDRTYYREANFPSQAGWTVAIAWGAILVLTIVMTIARFRPTELLLLRLGMIR
jgi:energy-coupling factor transport system permease protein